MGRHVVVTGASSGIGAACVEAFQEERALVVGVDRETESGADLHCQIDLEHPDCGDQLAALVGDLEIEGLVNSAAIPLAQSADLITANDFDRVMAINLRAPLLLASSLRRKIATMSGFVVNVASVHALATSPNASVYAASKGGLISLTRALALEWAPDIRVNAVVPGAIDSPMLSDGLKRTGTSVGGLGAGHPLGRVGRPDEVAQIVVVMSKNRFMTGSSVTIDGGATARLSTE